MYAAFKAAREHVGQPTVILAHTIKGWTLGTDFEARNATHQMKKLTMAELKEFRDRLYLPIPDAALEADLPPYYHPGEDSDEIQYMQRAPGRARRLPAAAASCAPGRCTLPADASYDDLRKGSGKQPVATTMAFVRLLKDLMKDKEIGARFVPIIPDEARTFGMDSLFPTAKIYSPHGQPYEAVDRDLLLSYKESTRGQILHEGISEAGSMASVIAAGTVLRHPRRADDPGLRLLLDVRLPAHRRPDVGARRPARPRASCSARPPAAPRSPARACSTTTATRCCSPRPTRPASPTTRPSPSSSPTSSRTGCAGCTARARGTRHGEDVFYYLTVYNEPYPQPAEPADYPGGPRRCERASCAASTGTARAAADPASQRR